MFRKLPVILALCAGIASLALADEPSPCPEGQKCYPSRPTLAQCAERISLEAGDVTYVNLISQAPQYIPHERAVAIAQHPLCYGRPPYAPLFLTEEEANPTEGSFGTLKWSAFKRGQTGHWGITYETVPFHKLHLAFIKHKVNGEWVVDVHTPPAYRAVTAEVLERNLAYLTKPGLASYVSWYRFGVNATVRINRLTTGFDPRQPPDVGFGFSYRFNQDLSLIADYTIPSNDWVYGISTSIPLLRAVGGLLY